VPIVKSIFLRFYAANLSRTRRNDPQRACADAIRQIAALGGIVSTTVYIVVGVLVSRALLRHMYAADSVYLLVSGGLGGLFGFWISRPFRAYMETPEAAAPYSSRSAIRVVNILYIAVPIAWVWLIGLGLRLLDAKG
jgi:hypothetical protein